MSTTALLISALQHEILEMPPKGKLPDAVIADFVTWVEMGAPDPRDGEAVAESRINFEEARKFWSYQPIAHPEVPKVQRADWPQNEIDHFTLSKMEQLWTSSSRASRQTGTDSTAQHSI